LTSLTAFFSNGMRNEIGHLRFTCVEFLDRHLNQPYPRESDAAQLESDDTQMAGTPPQTEHLASPNPSSRISSLRSTCRGAGTAADDGGQYRRQSRRIGSAGH
jgi:hypothetical protein